MSRVPAAGAIVGLVLTGCTMFGTVRDHVPSTTIVHLEPCESPVVTVWRDDPIGCDVTPPQRLDVIDVSRADCDDMGGTYVAPATCRGVDY